MNFHKPDMEKQSKHASIFLDIAKSIRSGKLRAGEKTPSENDIIAAYGVSNTTARKALSELERAGLAKRVRGKGTVVTAGGKTLTREIGSFDAFKGSFSENLVREGFIPKVEIVESGVVSDFCGAAIGGNFYEIKGKIFKIRMLRYGGALLLKDETRYLNLDLCDGIQKLGDFDPARINARIAIRHKDRKGCAGVFGRRRLQVEIFSQKTEVPDFFGGGVPYEKRRSCGNGKLVLQRRKIQIFNRNPRLKRRIL